VKRSEKAASDGGGRNTHPTMIRIVQCAADLFAVKGFTETSVRELAIAADLQVSALYYYFPTKNAILEHILNDFTANSFGNIVREDMLSKLTVAPTSDGILSCMNLRFPEGREEYYLKVLGVILQEQHRNPVMRDFVKAIILNAERQIRIAFEIFKEMGVFPQSAAPEYWMNIISSLLYTYASRAVLGIGDNSPKYVGMGLVELLRTTYNLMFQDCVARKGETEP